MKSPMESPSPEQASIPFHYGGNQFRYDHPGRHSDDLEHRRQRETHAKTTDEYLCIFDRAKTATGKLRQRIFGVVHTTIHQIARHTGNTNRKIIVALRQGQFCIATSNSGARDCFPGVHRGSSK